MRDLKIHFLIVGFLAGCHAPSAELPMAEANELIRALDMSRYPQMRSEGVAFADASGRSEGLLPIVRQAEINMVRLRVWVDPEPGHGYAGLDTVSAFAAELRVAGLGVWLTIHYSDFWADPGQQVKPLAWQNLPFAALRSRVGDYTRELMRRVQPDLVQVGNEINNGLLHPEGHRWQQPEQMLALLGEGVSAVRQAAPKAKVMLHFAGYRGAEAFCEQVDSLDYDLIGLSYYPRWHGQSLDSLEQTLVRLEQRFARQVMIAETAYPFTLGWADHTNNVIGMPEQLLPGFPATPAGQSAFVRALRERLQSLKRPTGICYWGAELVAWRGQTATDGSPWENQAVFDFDHQALPVLETLGKAW